MPEKINQELQSVYLKGINLNERLIREREQVLINQYRKSLKNTQALIAQMYAKYGDKVTFDQMAQYQRLTGLENEITREIQTLTRTSQTAIRNSITDGHQMSYQHAGFGFETTLQTNLAWGLLNKDQLKAAIYNPMDRIKWDTRNLANAQAMTVKIREAVTSGLIEGKGYYKTAREVAEEMQIGLNKAKRIVRTESHRAQVAGRKAGINKLKKRYKNTDTVIEEFWDATLDGDTRPNHGSMEGIPSDENGKFLFTTMKGSQLLVDGPGLTGTTDDIHCRCGLTTRMDGVTPKMRRDNELKKNVPYTTYKDWYESKYNKKLVLPKTRIRN